MEVEKNRNKPKATGFYINQDLEVGVKLAALAKKTSAGQIVNEALSAYLS